MPEQGTFVRFAGGRISVTGGEQGGAAGSPNCGCGVRSWRYLAERLPSARPPSLADRLIPIRACRISSYLDAKMARRCARTGSAISALKGSSLDPALRRGHIQAVLTTDRHRNRSNFATLA